MLVKGIKMKPADNLRMYRFPKMYNQYKLTKIEYSKIFKDTLNWITGFWEGEGSITRLNKISLRFTVAQRDITPLLFIKKILKAGHIVGKNSKKDIFSYELNGTGRVLALLETILPYIRSKFRKIKVKKMLLLLNKIERKANYYLELKKKD